MLTLPGDPLFPTIPDWEVPEETRFVLQDGARWQPLERPDRAPSIRSSRYFNARKLDLPDGFFDRRTQFVINGAPFETLLGQSPNDPLILMLARGPAGFRFTAKALQHAIPDAQIERGEIVTDGDPSTLAIAAVAVGHVCAALAKR